MPRKRKPGPHGTNAGDVLYQYDVVASQLRRYEVLDAMPYGERPAVTCVHVVVETDAAGTRGAQRRLIGIAGFHASPREAVLAAVREIERSMRELPLYARRVHLLHEKIRKRLADMRGSLSQARALLAEMGVVVDPQQHPQQQAKRYLPDGTTRTIWSDAAAARERAVGGTPRRASRIEVIESGRMTGLFHVDFSPLAALLGDERYAVCLPRPFLLYADAVEAEVQWLLDNFVLRDLPTAEEQ